MEIMQALRINGKSFKVHNRTEYYLDQFIYSSYGFEIYYRNRRGIQNLHWRDNLNDHLFDPPVLLYKGLYTTESRITTLDFHKFMTRPFVLHWTLDECWYGLGFDGNEFILQDNNDNIFLPDVIL